MNPSESLDRRLRRLEDIEAIRQLKARYFLSCDRKDPQGMRDCFADGEVEIDFGIVGQFDHADKLVEVFRTVGCHPHMVELHHGVNPLIELISDDDATGIWSLHYFLINTQEQSSTQLAGRYEDRYRRIDDQWKMQSTRFVATSNIVVSLSEQQLGLIFAGRPPTPSSP